jgi:YKOF-related Family.
MLSCEVSLFPLEVVDSDAIINQSLKALKITGIKHEIGNQSTYLYSDNPDQIWNGLQTIYREAQKAGTEFSMVINLSNNT